MLQLILFFSLLTSTPDKQQIASVEKDFYKNLKQIDSERHRNYTAQFRKIFQQQHSSPYKLYEEITQIELKATQQAKKQAVATGYKEREYSRFVGDIRDGYMADLLKRYKMSIDQRNMFRNNYRLLNTF